MTASVNTGRAAGGGLRLLIAGKFASTVAYATSWVLLPLYVYEASGSAIAAALASASNVVPFLLFGLLAGSMVDRSSPTRLMAWMECANAAVLLCVPLLVATVGAGPVALCLIGFASATAYVWFDVASAAAVPALAGKDGVFRANSRLWTVTTVLTAVAAPLGLFLLDALRLGPTFAVLAGCYLVSALLIALVRLPADAEDRRPPGRGAVWAGIRFITAHPLLRVYTAVNVGVGLSAGAVYGMLVVFASEALDLDTDDYRMAWIIAASGVGALCGALLAPRFKSAPPIPVARWMIGVELALLLAYAAAPDWTLAAAALLCWNTVHTCFLVVGVSVRQTATPQSLQGRVNAVGRMIVWGSVPAGTLLCGWLTDAIGPRPALAALAVCALASLVAAMRAPRGLRAESTTTEPPSMKKVSQ
ncbi:MFS transporter [Glycomyces tenuis]|uniref:MFS transporter n=1 Tax=Glycomyces tenuis TaxID=58116 RepID=UPI000415D6DB|nr:MFS transporter [Glycomyces tenuis]